jgi:hypothetical protein
MLYVYTSPRSGERPLLPRSGVSSVPYHHLMPVDVSKQRLPSAEDEARFWVRVEAAWAQCSAEANRVRRALAARVLGPDTDLCAVEGALPVFVAALTDQCRDCLAVS